MVESSIVAPCESTISAGPVHFLALFSGMFCSFLTFLSSQDGIVLSTSAAMPRRCLSVGVVIFLCLSGVVSCSTCSDFSGAAR